MTLRRLQCNTVSYENKIQNKWNQDFPWVSVLPKARDFFPHNCLRFPGHPLHPCASACHCRPLRGKLLKCTSRISLVAISRRAEGWIAFFADRCLTAQSCSRECPYCVNRLVAFAALEEGKQRSQPSFSLAEIRVPEATAQAHSFSSP